MLFPDLEQIMIAAELARQQQEKEEKQLQRLTNLHAKATKIVTDGWLETVSGEQRKVATMFLGEVRYQVSQQRGEARQPITVTRGGRESPRPGTDRENDATNEETGRGEGTAPYELAYLMFNGKSFAGTKIMGRALDPSKDFSQGLAEVDKALGLWDKVLVFKDRQ